MDVQRIAEGLHTLERRVVPHLKKRGSLAELSADSKISEVEAMRAIQWLEGKGCLKIETEEQEYLAILERGKRAHKEGLPEQIVFSNLKERGRLSFTDIPGLLVDTGAKGAVIGQLKRAGIPTITDDEGKPAFTYVNGLPEPTFLASSTLMTASENDWVLDLSTASKEELAGAEELLKREGYAERIKRKKKMYTLTPLGKHLTTMKLTAAGEDRLTQKMLKDGSWQRTKFRPYNVTINVPRVTRGRKHFVNEAIDSIRRIWIEMGFQEMTGNDIQTAFWDLDALFVPQDHPAREMQDTFYLANPAKGRLPSNLAKRVKQVHEDGGDTGSLGWRYEYSAEEAKRNLLRTHTTVLSAQTLERIGKGELPMPGKYFSVAKVYRNEALDWKHLFEFFQVEGIVVADGMTMQHLKGYLRTFFTKMGYTDIRIRPGHFPYTEPSAEVDVWDPKRKEWVELGGSGIFRPEVTKTLIGKEVPVLAWGLGMERTIKEYYNITDIRDLYNNDIEQMRGMRAWRREEGGDSCQR